MEREGKLFSNTLLLGAASVISKAITFFMLPLYTAALSPAEFGVVDILVSTAVLLLPIVSLHAPEAVFRFYAGGERGAVRVGAIFLVAGLLLFLVSLPLLRFFEVLRPFLWLLYAYVAASLARSFVAHLLRAKGAFGLYAIQQVFCTALTVVFQVLFLTVWRRGVSGYLLSVVLADAITFAILLLSGAFSKSEQQEPTKRELFGKMARYALPMIPSTVLWWVMAVSDRYLILFYGTKSDTGLYAAAGRLPALLTLAVSLFLETWHFATVREKGSGAALFSRIYALLLPALIALGVALSILALPIITIFFAPDYISAARLVPMLVVGALCGGLANFFGSIYTLQLRSVAALVTGLVAGGANILLNLLFIPRYGTSGAAFSTLAAYALLLFLRLFHTRRLLDFPRYTASLSASLALLLVAGVSFLRAHVLLGTLLALLALAPVWQKGWQAVRFLYGRGMILFKELKKRGKYSKKI